MSKLQQILDAAKAHDKGLYNLPQSDVDMLTEAGFLFSQQQQFSPLDIANCILWLDASDSDTITKDVSDKVSQWDDKSGNNHHATQGTATNQPTWVDNQLNGKPIIRFDGADDVLRTATGGFSSMPLSMIAVMKKTSEPSVASVIAIMGKSESEKRRSLFIWNGGSGTDYYFAFSGYGVPSNILSNQVIDTNFHLLEAVLNSSKLCKLYYDTSFLTSKTLVLSSFTETGINIANNEATGADEDLHGEIAELLIYNHELTDTERQNLESCLNNKWGL